MACVTREDVGGVEVLLAESVQVLSDGAGEFVAARVPVVGRSKVARFLVKLSQGGGAHARVQWRTVNGHAALLLEHEPTRPNDPPRVLITCDTDRDGQITAFYMVLATSKLTAVHPIQ